MISCRRTALPLLALLCVIEGVASACKPAAAAPPKPGFHVVDETVALLADTPVHFDTMPAAWGPPLPLPPVTARVTTPDARTSPSFAPLPGRVVENAAHLGDRVKKGQKLVLIRTAELPIFQRDVRAAELLVGTRTASLSRLRELVAARVGSQNDVMLAESELAQAKLAESEAKARISSLQVTRADDTSYWILAGRDGTIVQLDATVGLQVGPDRSAPVATVADLSELVVVADVPQRDAIDLVPGTVAQIMTEGVVSAPFEGIVQVVSEVVDPERQTVPVRIRLSNEQRKLRPNAYVDVSFGPLGHEERLILPASSVVRDGSSAIVFVEIKPGVFQKRTVTLGRQAHEKAEILSGVKVGERVVTSGALLLLNAVDERV